MLKITDIRSDHKLNREELKKKTAKLLRINTSSVRKLSILKESIDARHKGRILYIYSVEAEADDEKNIIKSCKNPHVSIIKEKPYILPGSSAGVIKSSHRPIIAGFGPAGMFAALYLSYAGLEPIVLERGEDVDSRTEKVRIFWEKEILDTNSNVQFGEGGAGTFSDGKLSTGIRDKAGRDRFILNSFVKYGANESILTDSKPHIGSDVLRTVVKNLREDVIAHGGEVRFNSTLTGFETDSYGHLKAVIVNNSVSITCENLILAIGHSARDTFSILNDSEIRMEPKSFAVGLRVQHPQELINRAMYGEKYDPSLPPSSYKLTHRSENGRGVYSFCMCPGGYVVNASSEEGKLCINGMSYSGRKGENANSAIVVTVTQKDFLNSGFSEFGCLSGVEFQRMLERRAYNECRGLIPCQRLFDFRADRITEGFGHITPTCKGSFSAGNLRNILPSQLSEDLISSFEAFGKKIKGFDDPDSVLSGVESRTSSPVRILRNEAFLSSVPGIYPSGEGAGYAGGIMSAAIDGLKCAEAVLKVTQQG